MHAIPEHLRDVFTTRCYTNPRLPLPYLYLINRCVVKKLTMMITGEIRVYWQDGDVDSECDAVQEMQCWWCLLRVSIVGFFLFPSHIFAQTTHIALTPPVTILIASHH